MAVSNEKIEKLAAEVIHMAKNSLVINLRFMDRAISMLEPVCTPELGLIMQEKENLFAVDGKHVYYDPVCVLNSFSSEHSRPIRQYLHMVFHCVYSHFWVSTLVNRDYWDIACDIAVEHSILGLDVPSLAIAGDDDRKNAIEKLSREVKYLTADHLYKYFLDHGLLESEIKSYRELFSMDLHLLWYEPKVRIELETKAAAGSSEKPKKGDKGKKSGSGSGDKKEEDGGEGPGEDGPEPVQLTPGAKQMLNEWQETARRMKMDIETFSKLRGTEAGGMTQNLEAVTREKYDYTGFLRQFAVLGERMKINDDEFDYIFYTYGMQLYGKMPLIEPLEYKDTKQIREFVIAIDTSGSTSGELVQRFLNKTYNILHSEESFFRKFNLHIIQCDADLQEDSKITSAEEFDRYIQTMKIRGLGGTDFRPVFTYVQQLIDNREFTNLKGLIYFTDGFGVFPEKQPPYHTAFVYVDEGYNNPEVPVWAIKLVLRPEEI